MRISMKKLKVDIDEIVLEFEHNSDTASA